MKFDILAGTHAAKVEINLDGRGGFTGTLDSGEFGRGEITEGQALGGKLKGKVSLAGHEADFEAVLDVPHLAGQLTAKKWGITFYSEHFTGTQTS